MKGAMLDAAVAGDDQPAGLGDDGDPHGFERGAVCHRTRRAGSAMHGAAWVGGVGGIRAQAGDDLGEAEDVRVEVEADLRGLAAGAHAARRAFS